MRNVSIAVTLFALTVWPIAALAQDDKCPKGFSNDDCDGWHFEGADKVLTDVMDSKIVEQSKLTTRADVVEAIKRTSLEAHRAWVAFREAECRAYVAASVMSARTEKGRMASCLLLMTERRIAEVKKF
jgi:uncharacterized protein YecT (DUF1311 family)